MDSTRIMAEMSHLIRKYHIKAVLTSTDATFTSHAVDQAARYLGLPVICWQHGSVIGRNNNIELNEYNDLMTSTHFLAYGEGVSQAYRPFTNRFPSEIVPIGSARFDHIREKEKSVSVKTDAPRTKRILYATSPYYGGMWYGGLSPPFNDRLLYREQSVIVKYLRALAGKYGAGFSVTIKLHPSPFPEDPFWVTELLAQPEIRVVKQSPTFTQLLERSDVIVLDSPTTTALQAAATRKPLFVLMSVIVYPERAREMLERRAICADEAGELMVKLDRYLETGIYGADVMDNEFLKAYGIYLDDGRSAERAVAEVLKTVGGI